VANRSEHTAFANAKAHLYASALVAQDKATIRMVEEDITLLGSSVRAQAEDLVRKGGQIAFGFVPGPSVGGSLSEGSLALTGLAVSQQEDQR
jgi:hypothetical protein